MANIDTVNPDLTGSDSSYLVEEEIHSITEGEFSIYNSITELDESFRFIFPDYGPFHINNLQVWNTDPILGTDVLLSPGTDYNYALEYVAATRASLSPVYRAINIINDQITNDIKITYQALGGLDALGTNAILTKLINMEYSPRTTVWDNVMEVPLAFPPGIHYHESNDLVYESALIDKLDEIKNAIGDAAQTVASDLVDYINALD